MVDVTSILSPERESEDRKKQKPPIQPLVPQPVEMPFPGNEPIIPQNWTVEQPETTPPVNPVEPGAEERGMENIPFENIRPSPPPPRPEDITPGQQLYGQPKPQPLPPVSQPTPSTKQPETIPDTGVNVVPRDDTRNLYGDVDWNKFKTPETYSTLRREYFDTTAKKSRDQWDDTDVARYNSVFGQSDNAWGKGTSEYNFITSKFEDMRNIITEQEESGRTVDINGITQDGIVVYTINPTKYEASTGRPPQRRGVNPVSHMDLPTMKGNAWIPEETPYYSRSPWGSGGLEKNLGIVFYPGSKGENLLDEPYYSQNKANRELLYENMKDKNPDDPERKILESILTTKVSDKLFSPNSDEFKYLMQRGNTHFAPLLRGFMDNGLDVGINGITDDGLVIVTMSQTSDTEPLMSDIEGLYAIGLNTGYIVPVESTKEGFMPKATGGRETYYRNVFIESDRERRWRNTHTTEPTDEDYLNWKRDSLFPPERLPETMGEQVRGAPPDWMGPPKVTPKIEPPVAKQTMKQPGEIINRTIIDRFKKPEEVINEYERQTKSVLKPREKTILHYLQTMFMGAYQGVPQVVARPLQAVQYYYENAVQPISARLHAHYNPNIVLVEDKQRYQNLIATKDASRSGIATRNKPLWTPDLDRELREIEMRGYKAYLTPPEGIVGDYKTAMELYGRAQKTKDTVEKERLMSLSNQNVEYVTRNNRAQLLEVSVDLANLIPILPEGGALSKVVLQRKAAEAMTKGGKEEAIKVVTSLFNKETGLQYTKSEATTVVNELIKNINKRSSELQTQFMAQVKQYTDTLGKTKNPETERQLASIRQQVEQTVSEARSLVNGIQNGTSPIQNQPHVTIGRGTQPVPPAGAPPIPPQPPIPMPPAGATGWFKMKSHWNKVAQKEPFGTKLSRLWEEFQRDYAFDMRARINAAQGRVEKFFKRNNLGELPMEYRYKTMSAIYSGTDAGVDYMAQEADKILKKELKGISRDDFAQYLSFLQEQDILKVHPNRKLPSGLTKQEIDDFGGMANLFAQDQLRQMQSAAHMIHDINIAFLYQKAEEAPHLITRELADKLRQMYPNYIPTNYLDALDDALKPKGVLKSAGNITDDIKRLTEEGTEMAIANPLDSMVNFWVRSQQIVNRNKVQYAAANIAQLDPNIVAEMTRIPASEKGEIAYITNGVRRAVEVPLWFQRDVEYHLNRGGANKAEQLARILNAIPRFGITGGNPVFWLKNIMIDLPVAMMSEHLTLRNAGRSLVMNFRSIVDKDPQMIEMMTKGLGVGHSKLTYRGQGKGTSVPGSILFGGDSKWNIKNLSKTVLDKWEDVGFAFEMTPRVATVLTDLERGLPWDEAIMHGRSATVDFYVMSKFMEHANNYYLYLNPGIQGAMIPIRALQRHPVRSAISTAVLASMAVGAYMWNDQFPEFHDIPAWQKYKGTLLMIPTWDKGELPDWLRDTAFEQFFTKGYDTKGKPIPKHIIPIPNPRELAGITGTVWYMMDLLKQEDPISFGEFIQAMSTYVNPFTQFVGMNNLSATPSPAAALVPTKLGSAAMEVALNKNFAGYDVLTDELSTKPPKEQYDKYNTLFSIRLGDMLNWSPKLIDHWVGSFMGSMGRDVQAGFDLALQKLEKDPEARIQASVEQLERIREDMISKGTPNKIASYREQYLGGFDEDTRKKILDLERKPEAKIPFATSLAKAFYGEYGGGHYRKAKIETIKENAAKQRAGIDTVTTAEDDLNTNIEKLVDALLNKQISPAKFFDQKAYYEAVHAGAKQEQWRMRQLTGSYEYMDVVDKMPDSYKPPTDLMALYDTTQFYYEKIQERGGALDSTAWDRIHEEVRNYLGYWNDKGEFIKGSKGYSPEDVLYAQQNWNNRDNRYKSPKVRAILAYLENGKKSEVIDDQKKSGWLWQYYNQYGLPPEHMPKIEQMIKEE